MKIIEPKVELYNTNINYNFPISNFGDDKFKICIPH